MPFMPFRSGNWCSCRMVATGKSHLGMLFGAVVGAVASKEFFIRFPQRLSEWVLITIGGLLMGVGIRLASYATSRRFSAHARANLGGYLAISGIIASAWVGSLSTKTRACE